MSMNVMLELTGAPNMLLVIIPLAPMSVNVILVFLVMVLTVKILMNALVQMNVRPTQNAAILLVHMIVIVLVDSKVMVKCAVISMNVTQVTTNVTSMQSASIPKARMNAFVTMDMKVHIKVDMKVA